MAPDKKHKLWNWKFERSGETMTLMDYKRTKYKEGAWFSCPSPASCDQKWGKSTSWWNVKASKILTRISTLNRTLICTQILLVLGEARMLIVQFKWVGEKVHTWLQFPVKYWGRVATEEVFQTLKHRVRALVVRSAVGFVGHMLYNS